jgi:hypothetical protein
MPVPARSAQTLGLMKLHPLTLDYLSTVALRPGMYMRDYDLRALELQLFGFEAGLHAAGVFGEFDHFNPEFCKLLSASAEISCSQGWAEALLKKHGQTEHAFNQFLALLSSANPGRAPELSSSSV